MKKILFYVGTSLVLIGVVVFSIYDVKYSHNTPIDTDSTEVVCDTICNDTIIVDTVNCY